jgi:cell division protein FtsB
VKKRALAYFDYPAWNGKNKEQYIADMVEQFKANLLAQMRVSQMTEDEIRTELSKAASALLKRAEASPRKTRTSPPPSQP